MTRASFEIGNGTGSLVISFREADRFLSNFWPCHVTLPKEDTLSGLSLPAMDFGCVELAYMAWKTIDLPTREKIMSMSPGDAKNFSKEPNFPLRPDYSDNGRLEIVTHLVREKFGPKNPNLRTQLLETGNIALVEGNTWGDIFFGFDLLTGEGQNHLGRILMKIRSEILSETQKDTKSYDFNS